MQQVSQIKLVSIEITFLSNCRKLLHKEYDKLENIERLLLEKSNERQPEADQLLTVQQAAEILCLSVPTIYGLVSKAEIPVSKKGKRLYFSKQELIAWIKTGRKKTLEEIASEADNYLQSNKKKGLK